MTGKEALEKLLDTLKYWQGRNAIFDKAQGDCILKELELLTKYKRAFEILKPFIKVYQWLGKDFYELDIEYVSRRISQEQYELLEELMKDE